MTCADPGYPVVYVNTAFTEPSGCRAQEIIERTPAVLQGSNADSTLLDQLNHALSKSRPLSCEPAKFSEDGSAFDMEWRMVTIKNQKTETSHYIAVHQNVIMWSIYLMPQQFFQCAP